MIDATTMRIWRYRLISSYYFEYNNLWRISSEVYIRYRELKNIKTIISYM